MIGLLVAVFCTMAATAAQVTSLGKQLYDLTGRELDLGLLGLAEFAPAAILVLVTGPVVDRHERPKVAALALAAAAVVSGALALYAGSNPTAAGPIFALVFVYGIARAFASPSTRALLGDVVEPERVPWLVARFSMAWQSALVVGPVLGGFLYAADVRLPYVGSAVLLVVGAVAVSMVRPQHAPTKATRSTELGSSDPAHPVRAGWHEAAEGFRFIRGAPVLLGALSLDLFAVLFGGAVALLPAIAKDRLHVDAVGLGWLRAASGLGAGAMTVALSVRPVRKKVGSTLFTVVAAFGIFTIVLGVTRSFAVAFVAMVALSAVDAVSVFIRSTLVPLVTPTEKRGRVLAVENVFIGGSNELGAFESGVVGQLLGPSGAVVLGGAATVLVAGAWWLLFPDLRRVDRFPAGANPRPPI